MKPLNLDLFDPEEYIEKHQCLPVSSHSMYEPSSMKFHPDGLFSEVIFGMVGSPDRITKRGYMDLRTNIVTPHLYKNMLTLKGYYQDILAGREYAVFDTELKDFVKVPKSDSDANTGYSFFINHLPDVEFQYTNSLKRKDKINLMKKFADKLLMTKYIILPAGLRDVKIKDGRPTSEDINKLYQGLLSLTQAMPATGSDDKIFDAIRYQIQNKIQQIYTYITDILDGKGGFSQSKYAARAIAGATRNVITGPIVSRVMRPDSPNAFSCDEMEAPLFQAMKSAEALTKYQLKAIFFDSVFASGTLNVPLIDPETLNLQYYDLSPSVLKQYTTSDGISNLIDNFRDPHTHTDVVTVEVIEGNKKTHKYLYLVYDLGDEIYYFRNINDFQRAFTKVDSYTTQGIENLRYVNELGAKNYVVMGSTALRVYGYEHYNQDIDILVDDETFKKIKSSSDFTKMKNNVYRRNDGYMDVYNECIFKNESVDKELELMKKNDEISEIEGYRFYSPKMLLQLYQTSNRAKDQEKIKFLKHRYLDLSKVRPMTYIEMFYCATYMATKNKHCTCTRHPVANLRGISLFKVHLMSTVPSRIVTMKVVQEGMTAFDVVLPEYPLPNDIAKSSMSMHPSTLPMFNGDHDGDVLGMIILQSDEANKEIEEYFESPLSMLDATGNLVYNVSDEKTARYTFYATSYHPLD